MKKILIPCFLAMVLLAACGGAAATPSTTIVVTLTDFQFSPNTFTVPAGEEITLQSTNSGAVIHNFIIMKQGYTVGAEFDEEDDPNVYWKVEIAAGGETQTTFTSPAEPGAYELVCSTPGHVQAGMVGTLNVVDVESE